MIILPAIDLIGGKCVRLKQGRYDDVTVITIHLWTRLLCSRKQEPHGSM